MALQHILGMDHALIAVRDLAAAAQTWRALGFTVSPRGEHSPQMGTANHTIVFGHDYLELLGVLRATDFSRSTAAFLRQHEGLQRIAFTTDDAAALVAELRTRGVQAQGPVDFGRPVTLPDGGTTEARFRIATWPDAVLPAGIPIFACEHKTRAAVWVPTLQHHANGARGILRVEIVADDPNRSATEMADSIAQTVEPADSGMRVHSGPGRADLLFLSPATFTRRYPAAVREGSAAQGAVVLVLTVDTVISASGLPGAIPFAGDVVIPAACATGVILRFTAGH